jgi:hypothetical protein
MSRTLDQIDLALKAVETQLPRVNAGLQTTLRQNNLVLESAIGTLTETVGAAAADGQPATGLVADIANLTALVEDLRGRVAALEANAA